MGLPKDPNMLLSYVNTQLRDEYESLSELASSLGIPAEEIKETLGKAGFTYREELNRFVQET